MDFLTNIGIFSNNILNILKSDIFDEKYTLELIKDFIVLIKNKYPEWDDNIDVNKTDELINSFKKIKDILNIDLEYLNSDNIMQKIKLVDFLDLIKEQNYHQNINTKNLMQAFPTKVKNTTVSCDFHKESLFEHSIMAFVLAMLHSIKSNKNIINASLTALLHDIGKVNCMCVYGKNLGYPYHGSYGSAILLQYGCYELFEKLGGKQNWLDICRSIAIHMCSYHTTVRNSWNNERRKITQIENPNVKNILESLSYGDSFGKYSVLAESSTTDFINSREDYNEDINKVFEVENWINNNNIKVPVFFVRGSSGSGKTHFINNSLKPYLLQFFNETQLEIISRDEILTEMTAKILNIKKSKNRPIGQEYKELYEKYKELKLGKFVNAEIKKRISITISQGRIPIIDSCILYYEGIVTCIPINIANTMIIAIDCVRNTSYTNEDLIKNGMEVSNLENLYNFRNPLKWIDGSLKLTILDSKYTHNMDNNLEPYLPHLVFSSGWNQNHECGKETLFNLIKPFMEYFSENLLETNTDNMNIIEYVNYIYKKFGLNGLKDTLSSQAYLVNDSFGDQRILRMNYLESNKLWRPIWSRQTRGTIFFLNDKDIWVPIKSLLERGTELLTGLHITDGITETDNINIEDLVKDTEDEAISKITSNMINFDSDQINLMIKLIFNKKIEDGLALSFKKDGSLLGCSLYKNKEISNYIKELILNSNDLFAKAVIKLCDENNIPLLVFSTQSTLSVGTQMYDYTINALLASLVFDDDKLSNLYNNGDYLEAFEKYGGEAILKIYNLIQLIDKQLNAEETDTITVSMESICKNRKSVFKDSLAHSELALSYPNSSITVLGVSFANEQTVKFFPHYEFSNLINDVNMQEPAFWFVNHTNDVNLLLTQLNNVIYNQISESEFYVLNPPFNKYNNYDKIVDYEGFVSYSLKPTANNTLNYNKIKTSVYYDLHKLKKNKISHILELAEIPSICQRFPMCNEIKIFYQNLDNIEKLFNMVYNNAISENSIIYANLSDKAKISFHKQTKDVQLKMLINSQVGFRELALSSFKKIYSFDETKVNEDFKQEVHSIVKRIMMNSISGYDLSNLQSSGLVDELFLLSRKALNSFL